jgi:hypothetical protein
MINTTDQFPHCLLLSKYLFTLRVLNDFLFFCDRCFINGTCPSTYNNTVVSKADCLDIEFRIKHGLLRIH